MFNLLLKSPFIFICFACLKIWSAQEITQTAAPAPSLAEQQKRIKAETIVADLLSFDPEITKIWKKVASDSLYSLPEDQWGRFTSFIPRLFTTDMDGYQRALIISSFVEFPADVWDESSEKIPQFFDLGHINDAKKVKKSTAFYNTLIVSAFSKVPSALWPGFIEYAQQIFEALNARDYKHEMVKRIANVPTAIRTKVLVFIARFLPPGMLEFQKMRVLSGFCRPNSLLDPEAFDVFLDHAFKILTEVNLENYGATIDNLGSIPIAYREELLRLLKHHHLKNPAVLDWLVQKHPTQWDAAIKNYLGTRVR